MSKRKPTTLSIGTISEGTLRSPDLIQAYLSALDDIRLTQAERNEVENIRKAWDDIISDDDADVGDDVGTLAGILDAHCPPYCYFGAHHGDGACFGVWPDPDFCREDDDVYASNFTPGDSGAGEERQRAAEQGASFWLHVNDHGNATLYRRTHRKASRWIIVWSIV